MRTMEACRRWRRSALRAALCALAVCLIGIAAACAPRAARADEARNIAAQCRFVSPDTKSPVKALCNGTMEHYFATAKRKTPYIQVELPKGERCSGVMIKWAKLNPRWEIQTLQDGAWRTFAKGDAYLTSFTPMTGQTAFRIAAPGRVSDDLRVNELYVLGEGDAPDWVQRWQPTPEKADLLLVVAHPDDEFIFMGGIVPYYAGELGKHVLVAFITESNAQRRSELLDGLWAAGLREYPLHGVFHDRFSLKLKDAYRKLGAKKTKAYMVELFRKYKPDVVVTHDVNGEYGHAVHKLCADIVRYAANVSGNPAKHKDSAKAYGTWDVPKVYLHLRPDDAVHMDWKKPLPHFGGRTALDMAALGFTYHVSQQATRYRVEDGGEYDNAVFGLIHTRVGRDARRDDLFENLPDAPQTGA